MLSRWQIWQNAFCRKGECPYYAGGVHNHAIFVDCRYIRWGRQPKAIIAINRETGEIRSGQIAALEGYDYYLLKFGNSEYCSAELEMTYYKLATMAGINMMPSMLYSVDGNNHF